MNDDIVQIDMNRGYFGVQYDILLYSILVHVDFILSTRY